MLGRFRCRNLLVTTLEGIIIDCLPVDFESDGTAVRGRDLLRRGLETTLAVTLLARLSTGCQATNGTLEQIHPGNKPEVSLGLYVQQYMVSIER